MDKELIFRTVHGSRLYNLDHAGSDYDTYSVYWGKGKLKHKKFGVLDSVNKSMGQFFNEIDKGAPQALEALFSMQKEISDDVHLPVIIPNIGNATNTYRRTIRAFWLGNYKQRVHSVRLSINLTDLQRSGRFNPTLTDEQAQYAKTYPLFEQHPPPLYFNNE